ncbi:signal peptidase I [Nocardioides conyzicola]|uniref:Signal peptidase I n=1 Tax=Nocardioides conyzicola TaxID=1651781 RepID=A0ABP8WXL2_9ACTN
MEIQTAPRHPAPTPWWRLVLFVVIFGPVTLLVLLPIGLGLQRYVMTGDSMGGGLDRGSIAFERVVPVSDLRVGDVITFREPGAVDEDTLVTHRIVAIEADGIRTQGDAEPSPDPWLVRTDSPTLSRVEVTIPWIGWAYLFLEHPQGWVLIAAAAVVLAMLMSRRLRHPSPTVRVLDPVGTREAKP